MGRNLSKKLNKNQSLPENDQLNKEERGIVVGRFGQHADVRDLGDSVTRCHIRRTLDGVVCGDEVVFRRSKDEDSAVKGVIEAVEERRSCLSRPDFYDGLKPIAANIDQIIVVSSVLPAFSTNIVDRYLVASEDVEITPVILLNKVDLVAAEEKAELDECLNLYRNIGYEVHLVSCKSGEGVEGFSDCLKDKTSVFVGQSGVGKSSLINALLPEANELVGDISETSGLGQHTTTSAKLIQFANGGQLIDSPGVREFALWHLPVEQVTKGFVEFRNYIGGCKFRDCKHFDDPGCLLKEAVEKGEINPSRYENYHSILKTMEEQRPSFSTAFRK